MFGLSHNALLPTGSCAKSLLHLSSLLVHVLSLSLTHSLTHSAVSLILITRKPCVLLSNNQAIKSVALVVVVVLIVLCYCCYWLLYYWATIIAMPPKTITVPQRKTMAQCNTSTSACLIVLASSFSPPTSATTGDFEFDDVFVLSPEHSKSSLKELGARFSERLSEDIGCDEIEIVADEHGDFSICLDHHHPTDGGVVEDERIGIDDFEICSLVGKGAYGKV
jgi:hypothetical protein